MFTKDILFWKIYVTEVCSYTILRRVAIILKMRSRKDMLTLIIHTSCFSQVLLEPQVREEAQDSLAWLVHL